MNRSWQRIVSVVVATFIATSSASVCVPAIDAAEHRCTPRQNSSTHHCQPSSAMDCCATSTPQTPSVPQDTPAAQQSARSAATGSAWQADSAAVLDGFQRLAFWRVVHVAPLHGYRSTDLLTLNAVFLI